MSSDKAIKNAERTTISYAMDWGKNPLPPTLLATLVTALHMRPFQFVPMLFPPVLLFSTYLNINNFTVDSAGLTAAWSGLYLLLATRRNAPGKTLYRRVGSRFGARGLVRGSALGLAGLNVVGCGITYAFGRREKRDEDGKAV